MNPAFFRRLSVLFVVFSILFAILVSYTYVSGEDPIYYWDFKGYWSQFSYFGSLLNDNILSWGYTNLEELRSSDYNPSPVSILFPAYEIFGGGRVSYISALAVTYLVPASLISAYIVHLAGKEQDKSNLYIFMLLGFIALVFVPYWRPTIRGYPDIVGLLPLALSTLIVFKNDFSSRILIKKSLMLGLAIWLPFAFRRWYAYAVVSFFITFPFLTLYLWSSTEEDEVIWRKIGIISVNTIIAGIAALLLATILQYGLVMRAVTTDYSVIYSGWQAGRIASLEELFHNFGGILLPLMLIGVFWFNRSNMEKGLAGFALANLLITFLLFTHTQTPGTHHQLMFVFWVYIISGLGVINILSLAQDVAIKVCVSSTLVIIFLLVFLISLYRIPAENDSVSNLLPSKIYSLKLHKIDNYERLVSDLLKLSNGGEKISVLSSGYVLMDDMLSTLSNERLTMRFKRVSHSDLRDKLNLSTFTSKYVVVTDPVQTHLNPGSQNVITIPANMILNSTGIGKAYRRVGGSYQLDGGVEAFIYEKTRRFTDVEAENLLNQFYVIYPSWRSIYENNSAKANLKSD